MRKKFSPPVLIVFIFLLVILSGTLLLMLPFSTKNGISVIDALFTETSAVCVTGLIVKNTGQDFTFFGQLILLISIQLGGLGIMTISTFFYQLIKRDLSLRHQLVIRELVAPKGDFFDIVNLSVKVITYTVIFEAFGAFFFCLKFIPLYGWGKGLFYSIFHSVSSFCNAGFSTFVDSFSAFSDSPLVLLTSSTLFIFGGLGFLILYELFELNIFNKGLNIRMKKFSVQTKLMLLGTVVLLAVGTIAMFFFERDNTLSSMGFFEKILVSFFHSATARTAGFNVIDLGGARPATLMMNELFMFIGAGPGSTAGGIKVTTFFLLLLILGSFFRQKDRVVAHNKAIPQIIVYRTITIFLVAIFWLFISFMALLMTNMQVPSSAGQDVSHRLFFELVSAFGTVGLSTGVTPYLNNIGKMIIIITMFLGRLGPTLIALSIKKSDRPVQIEYPEEQVMVG